MFTKTLISEFFTTININSFLRTISLLTYKLPRLRSWKYNKLFENELLSYLNLKKSKIISFYNWRSALFQTLKIIWIRKDDEVIVNWFTCISVSNSVIQSWAKIVYSDIDSYNLWFDTEKLEKNITKKTKVIIIQHTFWKPSNIDIIKKLTQKHNILLIEDCAHSLWSKKGNEKLWTFWDFSVFSTWRDKVISSITWWFLVINNKKYFQFTEDIKKQLKKPSILLTIRNLLYNIIWYLSYLFYDFFKIWKILIFVSRKLKLITEILTINEKKCSFNEFYYSFPNSLAYLAKKEIEKIKIYRNHRIMIAEYYDITINNSLIKIIFKNKKNEINNYFRYPILIKNEEIKNEFYEYMKSKWIILWNTWSWLNIVPFWSNINKSWYIKWSCSVAEIISKRILTLPNHYWININDVAKIVKLINNFKK